MDQDLSRLVDSTSPLIVPAGASVGSAEGIGKPAEMITSFGLRAGRPWGIQRQDLTQFPICKMGIAIASWGPWGFHGVLARITPR